MAYQQAVGGGAPVGIYAGLGLVASLIYALAAFHLRLHVPQIRKSIEANGRS